MISNRNDGLNKYAICPICPSGHLGQPIVQMIKMIVQMCRSVMALHKIEDSVNPGSVLFINSLNLDQ